MRKVRVGVLFGGQSGEHDVSLASATSVIAALDPTRYDVVPIGIDRSGAWRLGSTPFQLLGMSRSAELPDVASEPLARHSPENYPSGSELALREGALDVVFPVLHGPNGEDGTIQGVLRTAGIPFVGSDVLGSALGMDKWRMKAVFAQWGLPNVPHYGFLRYDWERHAKGVIHDLESKLQYPMFVKPSNMGSSVGISKVRDREELRHGIEVACCHDATIIVEETVQGREIECGVLGNYDPLVSVPGEIRPHHDFYDYEAKYTEGLAELVIPADLTDEQSRQMGDFARRAFLAVNASGLARVDFFLRSSDGEMLLNEINTMPGFTETSMFPKLWQATGVSYSELLDRLIDLALQRFNDEQRQRVH